MAVRYIVVGGLSIDTLSLPGESEPRVLCGGNALYAALGAAVWAGRAEDVGVVAAVGMTFPRAWLTAMRATGIDLTGVEERNGDHVVTFRASYDALGHRHVDVGDLAPPRDRTRALPVLERLPPAYRQAQAALCCQYGLKAQREHARYLQQCGLRVFLDPSEEQSASLSRRGLRQLLQPVEVFLPSEMEVPAFLVGSMALQPEEVVRALGQYGAKVVALKRGLLGSIVYGCGQVAALSIPAYPTTAVDPTGAGDAYAGGFMVSYIETGNLLEAALRATVAASFVVERLGALSTLQDLAMLQHEAHGRLEQLREL